MKLSECTYLLYNLITSFNGPSRPPGSHHLSCTIPCPRCRIAKSRTFILTILSCCMDSIANNRVSQANRHALGGRAAGQKKKGGCAVKNHCTDGIKWRLWFSKEAYKESEKAAVVKSRYQIVTSRCTFN